MLIGINGKIGAGKDTVGEIIQKLCFTNTNQNYEIKKFAGKLKQIASLLTGIPVEKFEDQEFKKTILGSEWGTVKENPLNSIPVFEDVKFNHLMSVRELLQKLGTEAMRDGLHTNVWVNALFADYKRSSHWEDRFYDELNKKGFAGREEVWSNYPNWIITDMRFPNELEAVVEKGGITIRVVRPETVTGEHPSEIALDGHIVHYEIINDGTIEDLIDKVREILINEKII
jgi:hypothetical protein